MKIYKKRKMIVADICPKCDEEVQHLAIELLNERRINFFISKLCAECRNKINNTIDERT